MEDVTDDATLFSSFGHFEEFSETLDTLLSLDLAVNPSDDEDRTEDIKFRKLAEIVID